MICVILKHAKNPSASLYEKKGGAILAELLHQTTTPLGLTKNNHVPFKVIVNLQNPGRRDSP